MGQGRFHDPEFRYTRGHVDVWRYTVNGNCYQCTAERKDPVEQAAYWQGSGVAAKRRGRRARQLVRVRVPVELLARDIAYLQQRQQPGETLAARLVRLAGFPSTWRRRPPRIELESTPTGYGQRLAAREPHVANDEIRRS